MNESMNTMKSLLETPADQRDSLWEDYFLTALTEDKARLIYTDPKNGPDGWPYLLAEVSAEPLIDGEPVQNILQWAGTRGIGLVINPQKEYPDFVLSYGMIWFFRETGRFFLRNLNGTEAPITQQVELTKATIQHAGTPHPKFLPDYVRSILREFFREQSLFSVKILVLSTDKVKYDLGFSIESLGNPPESEWPGIAEAIGWFLPPHYSVLLISEQNLPSFSEL